MLLALVLSLAIYTCSSLYGDKHSLPLPALRDYVSHLARATKYLVGHKPKIRPTPIYVAPRESAVRPQRPISLMDIRQAADNLVRTAQLTHRSAGVRMYTHAHRRHGPLSATAGLPYIVRALLAGGIRWDAKGCVVHVGGDCSARTALRE